MKSNQNYQASTPWLSHKNRPYRFVCYLASSWHQHIKRLSTLCSGQPESQFGADNLRKNHLSQKFAELRYIEIILVIGTMPNPVMSWSNQRTLFLLLPCNRSTVSAGKMDSDVKRPTTISGSRPYWSSAAY